MSRRRLIVLSFLGLGLAIVSTITLVLAFLGDGGYLLLNDDESLSWLNGWLLVNLVATVVLGPGCGVIAARMLVAAGPTRRPFRWTIMIVIGAAALLTWYEVGGLVISSSVHLDVAYVGTPPFDWAAVIGAAIPAVLYLVAAGMYAFDDEGQSLKTGTRAGLLILLLLSLVPVLNIVAFAGFVAWACRAPATPARLAVSA